MIFITILNSDLVSCHWGQRLAYETYFVTLKYNVCNYCSFY